ncbi:alpha/beta hydrolase [Ferrimicrobium sp.]|uniref:alpha/beta fold hydrolase n=1 Tax=Ferrimicrobium sp. TaxID=2926050 RepID=UPI002630E454|nr:alpha/beta hydrolase [Ferrimicrobium sp.]
MSEGTQVRLCYERTGPSDRPVVVLIHGLGGQLTDWPAPAIARFVEAGYQVLTYDQRDSGLSTRLTSVGIPDLLSIYMGRHELAPYTLADMADDLLELLDHLEIEGVHLVGVSMGAMVAQQFLIEQPKRVLSMISMLGTTGRAGVGQPSEMALAALMNPNAEEPLELVVGRPRSMLERQTILDRIDRAAARLAEAGIHDPGATVRQLSAILASPDRSTVLATLEALPSLVVHGIIDPLVNVSGGVDTFRVLAGSRLLLFADLGHDLPAWCWDRLATEMLATIGKVGG